MRTLAELLPHLKPFSTRHLTDAVLGTPVTAVTSDSRQAGPGSVFVAIPGAKADGRRYIPEALAKGCLAVVVEDPEGLADCPAPLIEVADSHGAISELAAAWNGYPAGRMIMIGITGTNGKTTCTWLLEGLLAAAGHRPGVIGTVNYRYHTPQGVRVLTEAPLTTPDPVTLQGVLRTMADDGVTHVIMEVSSHALDQQRLGRMLLDVALFTNLSRDHLDYHQTMEQYFAAKQRLFQRHLKPGGAAVIVTEPDADGINWGERLAEKLAAARLVRCGLDAACGVRAEAWEQSTAGLRCQLDLEGDRAEFTSALTGKFNLLNLLTAAGTGLALGLTPTLIRQGLGQVSRVPGRLERIRLSGETDPAGPAVFVDYAHTPDALENVLATLRALGPRRLICLVGCGGDRDQGKRPLMGGIAARYAEAVIVTSDNPRTEEPGAILSAIAAGVAAAGKRLVPVEDLLAGEPPAEGYAVIEDRHLAIRTACALAAPTDVALVAGKGHENYQLIGTTKLFFDDALEVTNALMAWNTRHLLAATGGLALGGSPARLLGEVVTDSRRLQRGDIFVALKGETFDGHAYIKGAVEQGAGAIVAERFPEDLPETVLCIEVEDTLEALGQLAGYRRRLLGPMVRVAAITGSSGKTSVKEMTAAIFAEATRDQSTGIDPVLKTQGNFNNLVGLPLSLLPLAAGHRLAILEMGMNVPGEIARLTAIADPDIGCINNVHPAHLQGLGSVEGVAAAKGELFDGMRPEAVRVVNCDDAHVLAQSKRSGSTQIGFAVTPQGRKQAPLVRVTRQVNLGEKGMRFTLHIGPWRQRLTVSALGAHNVSNCAAAAAIAHAAGIAPEIIVRGLGTVGSGDKRLAISELSGGIKVVNDAYNANPASMAAGLRTVAAFGAAGCRHLAALGDMLELGSASASLHREIGALVAQLGYDALAVTGSQAEVVAQAALAGGMTPSQVQIFPDPMAMAPWLCRMLPAGERPSGDWLLVKGSRGMRMERLIDALKTELQTDH